MANILCVIDGMNHPGFDAGDYPVLNSFPHKKYVRTLPDGFEAETLPCILSLLGITTPPHHIRGWIEALGAGIPVDTGDLFYRGSWVSLNDEGVCTGFCDAPSTIPDGDRARYYSLDRYRGLLKFPGQAHLISTLSSAMPFDMLGKQIDEYLCPDVPMLRDALTMLNSLAPKCAIIPWAPSVEGTLPKFPQKAAVVCGTNVVRGIARALDMRLETSSDMTGDVDTDLHAKLQITLKLAEEYPFVLLHIGGCDEAGHRMDKAEKDLFMKKIDKTVLTRLLSSNHSIAVVSDHGSDPLTGKHTGEKQPYFTRPFLP